MLSTLMLQPGVSSGFLPSDLLPSHVPNLLYFMTLHFGEDLHDIQAALYSGQYGVYTKHCNRLSN